jgi:hypothetical protein
MSNSTIALFNDKGLTCKAATETISSSYMFLYTKQLGFKPEAEDPFTNKTMIYRLSFNNIFYTDVLVSWNYYFLYDDRGGIREDIYNYTNITPQPEQVTQTSYNQPTAIPAFGIRFYLNDKFKKYNRSYQKLQDVLAALGGLMQLVTIILQFIVSFQNMYLMDMIIYKENFDHTIKENQIIQKPPDGSTNMVNLNNSNSIHSNYLA